MPFDKPYAVLNAVPNAVPNAVRQTERHSERRSEWRSEIQSYMLMSSSPVFSQAIDFNFFSPDHMHG